MSKIEGFLQRVPEPPSFLYEKAGGGSAGEVSGPKRAELNRARIAVFSLTGADRFLPRRLKRRKDRELTVQDVNSISKRTERGFIDAILFDESELNRHGIPYLLGLSEQEGEAFFNEPGHKPFSSGIEFSTNPERKKEQYLTIGRYLGLRYLVAKESGEEKEIEQARKDYRTFYEIAMYTLFGPAENALKDKINGINPQDRRNGTIQLSPQVTDELEAICQSVVRDSGEITATDLLEEVKAATEDGNMATALSFLQFHKGRPEVRAVLQRYLENRATNKDYIIEKLKLVYESHAFAQDMGVDIEMLYELNEYPEGEDIKSRLETYINGLREDAELQGIPVSYWDILTLQEQYPAFDDRVESPAKFDEKIREARVKVDQYFPITSTQTANSLEVYKTPTRIGAATRATTAHYPNTNKEEVTVVIVDPRGSTAYLAGKLGHERAHALHAEVLQNLPGSARLHDIPHHVSEDLAMLVEDGIAAVVNGKRTDGNTVEAQVGEGTYHNSLSNELVSKIWRLRRIPWAITQYVVRKKMEAMREEGTIQGALSTANANQIIDDLQPEVSNLISLGGLIEYPQESLLSYLSSTFELDGLAYVGEFVPLRKKKYSSPATTKAKPETFKDAFIEKYGEKWVEKPEAMECYRRLLAQTGVAYDQESMLNVVDAGAPA